MAAPKSSGKRLDEALSELGEGGVNDRAMQEAA
jgi:hypothetical protein